MIKNIFIQFSSKFKKNKVFYDKLTFIYIELPKFGKSLEELDSKIDKWLFIFRYLAKLQERPHALQERIFQKLFAATEIAKYSREEMEIYEESLKYYRDLNNIVYSAIVEGKVEGKIERTYEMAKSMKADGMPFEVISKYTGLSEDEINNL
jgi:predicted transposase/invertase (TIGR01784 family)